jgi:small nuclear ribonucleoprotein (snRNP)-like protein
VDAELKSGVVITGKLEFIDNNMCMLIRPDESDLRKLPPQFAGMTGGIYLRGSAIRAVYMPTIESELEMMKAMCQRKE